MDIIRRLKEDHLLGYIKCNQVYTLYLMPLAWWILNYSKYDPSYNPKTFSYIFRDNILNVSDNEVEKFIRSIAGDKVNPEDFDLAVDIPANYKSLGFFVDFDDKVFINGLYDNVEIEEYLPDETWTGKMGFPLEHIPEDLRKPFAS
jgi:hypothetical protein